MSVDQTARPSRVYGRQQPRDRGTLVVWTDDEGREHTRTWPNALPGHRSPCRIDGSKGLHQHRCSPAHRALVDGYRAIREVEERAAEAATQQYATELAEYWAAHPRTTFRDYLQGMAQKHAA